VRKLKIEAEEMSKKEDILRKRAFIQARIKQRKERSKSPSKTLPTDSVFDYSEFEKRNFNTPSNLLESMSTVVGIADLHIGEAKPYNTEAPKKI
jgi:hypothetical protein